MATPRIARPSPAPTRPYKRKLSREDAETGSILITKDRWRHFPPPMQEFAVRVGSQSFVTTIVSEDCNCVPPSHQHLHLQAGHFAHLLRFQTGEVIEVQPTRGAFIIRNG